MNRIEIVKKYAGKKEKPTDEELEEAYGYLDYCLDCGKEIKFGEAYSHCIVGNTHKFGCSKWNRILGRCYWGFISLLKLLIIILVMSIPYWLWRILK